MFRLSMTIVLYLTLNGLIHSESTAYGQSTIAQKVQNIQNGFKSIVELQDKGQFYDAIGQSEQLLFEVERLPSSIWQRSFYRMHLENRLGNLFREVFEFSKAEKHYLAALDAREARKQYFQTQEVNSAGKYLETGYLSEGALLKVSLSKVREQMGQQDSAKRLATEALNLASLSKENDNIKNEIVAFCQGHLGWLSLHEKEKNAHEAALNLYLNCQALNLKLADPLKIANSSVVVGDAYTTLGDFTKARENYHRALDHYQQYFGDQFEKSTKRALVLYNMARTELLSNNKNYQSITDGLNTALENYRGQKGNEDPDTGLIHFLRAWHFYTNGVAGDPFSEIDQARRNWKRYALRVLSAGSNLDQEDYLERKDRAWLHGALTLGFLERNKSNSLAVEKSAEWLINGKSLSFEVIRSRCLARRNQQLSQRLLETRQQLLELSLLPETTKTNEKNDRKRREIELIAKEKSLARELVRETDGVIADFDWVTLDQVRGSLPTDGILIEILRLQEKDFRQPSALSRFANRRSVPGLHWQTVDERYVAWLIPPQGQGNVTIVDLGLAATIDQAVKEFREELSAAIPDPQKPGRRTTIQTKGRQVAELTLRTKLTRLSKLLITPIMDRIGSSSRWVISPDSHLWNIPWSALPVKGKNGTEKYAIEDHVISLVTSGRELIPRNNPDKKSAPSYLFADMVYPSPIPKLENSWVEAALIQKHLQSLNKGSHEVNLLVGQQASLKTFEQSLGQLANQEVSPKVLVLSTHAYFKDDEETHFSGNPLLRCGILFSSTQGGIEKTILSGQRIIDQFALPTTDLVLLSACETGLGKVRLGEGPLSLATAFRLVGAKAVISTLWEAPDEDTTRITTDMFKLIVNDSLDVPTALAVAQRQLMESHRNDPAIRSAHPLYWAGLIYTGGRVRLR